MTTSEDSTSGASDDVPNLARVERLPDGSRWVHHDEAERVNQLLIGFFAPARPAGGAERQSGRRTP